MVLPVGTAGPKITSWIFVVHLVPKRRSVENHGSPTRYGLQVFFVLGFDQVNVCNIWKLWLRSQRTTGSLSFSVWPPTLELSIDEFWKIWSAWHFWRPQNSEPCLVNKFGLLEESFFIGTWSDHTSGKKHFLFSVHELWHWHFPINEFSNRTLRVVDSGVRYSISKSSPIESPNFKKGFWKQFHTVSMGSKQKTKLITRCARWNPRVWGSFILNGIEFRDRFKTKYKTNHQHFETTEMFEMGGEVVTSDHVGSTTFHIFA